MSLVYTNYKYSYYNDDRYDNAFVLQRYDWQRLEFDLTDDFDLESLAEQCAEDFYDNHDGWEYGNWCSGSEPITFYIWVDENTKVSYDVYMEFNPSFSAHKKES